MNKKLLMAAVMALAVFPPARAAHAKKAAPIEAGDVLKAIERGVEYLRREQSAKGHWDDLVAYPGGVTALCTLALLNAGAPPDDPTVSKALEYLREIKGKDTYVVALQTMALCAAEPKKDMLTIQDNVRWLEEAQRRDGERAGAWSYKISDHGGDNSNSQFAVLALYEAQRVGAKVKPQTLKRALEYWRNTQNEDGSWGYFPNDPGSGSMTSAGIAGIVTCSMALEEGDAQVKEGRIVCCAKRERDDALDKAIDWMGRNFTVRHNPRMPGSASQPCLYYYLYGLERAGRLTARRFMGDHDWYREGAEFVVREQERIAHSWIGTWPAERYPHVSTSLALLFLAKGRRPVVMAKLKHGSDDWNRHQKDAANLTTYTEQAWELDLTWQVYDPASAEVEDLLQAPVLYISGSRALELMPQAEKLRDYVDRGGFLFAEACCGNAKGFDEDFRKLMAAVFSEPEYQLRQLTPGHPIWRMEERVRPDSPYAGHLFGIEYGCRTCVVYSDVDLSCYWELARPGRWKEYTKPVVERVRDGLAVGLNVLTYATGREPKGKEQSFVTPLALDDDEALGSRGTIELVKLRHGGGCNDAPAALANLLRAASQGDLKLLVRTDARLINIEDDNLSRHHMAFMHGRHDFRLTPGEHEALARYLTNQGTLLVDAICASKSFTTALRRELRATLPQHALEAIPADDEIFTSNFGGYDVRQVMLREPRGGGQNQPAAARARKISPQLEGIRIGDRWAVIFSPYDLSCALEKHEALHCRGYTQQDAARLALNVLMYTLNQ